LSLYAIQNRVPRLFSRFHCYYSYSFPKVAFSPFEENLIACVSSQNFGIDGPGKLDILDIQIESGQILPISHFYAPDGLYDCAWSETNHEVIVAACADGSILLCDIKKKDAKPVFVWKEHTREVHSVNWNLQDKNFFISGGWDDMIFLWSVDVPTPHHGWKGHENCIFSVKWAPHSPDIFASGGGDNLIRLWDKRDDVAQQTTEASDLELLTLDWNKYNENILVSGGVDNIIRVWDLRKHHDPLCLYGHNYAVRNVKCSPHYQSIIASVAYDKCFYLWDILREEPIVEKNNHHTEFAVGCDFNLFIEGQVATCGWDNLLHVYQLGLPPNIQNPN